MNPRLSVPSLAPGEPVTVAFDVTAEILAPAPSFNVVGELPGGRLRDEVVMIGAHLDSWAIGTGATDDAAGSAIAIEAMRILAATKLPLARTVRIGLWASEELALYGSRSYVKRHFADRAEFTSMGRYVEEWRARGPGANVRTGGRPGGRGRR